MYRPERTISIFVKLLGASIEAFGVGQEILDRVAANDFDPTKFVCFFLRDDVKRS
jgi:hypothetical protein